MPAPTKFSIIVAFASLYLIWGSTYLGIRFAIETIPPFLMAGTRFLMAGVIMYAIAWSQGIGKSNWMNWRTSLIIGACLLLGGNGGVTMSEKYIDSGLAALIVAVVPIYIVVLGWTTGMTPKPMPILWLGLVGGFIGVGILLAPALRFSSNNGRHPAIGMSILLVSSFIWSAGSLFRWRRDRRNATFQSEFDINLVCRFICLFSDHRSRGWIHCLHLATATL